MIVYTYFEKCAGDLQYEDALQLWKNNWQEAGFTPVVTGPEVIPLLKLQKMREKFQRLPTVNGNKCYELANYNRALAMAAIGGGLWVETDILNVSFTEDVIDFAYPWITFDVNKSAAMWVSAEKSNYLEEVILNWDEKVFETGPHISTMLMWYKLPSHEVLLCGHFTSHQLQKSLLHVTYCDYNSMGLSRFDAIQYITNLISQRRKNENQRIN